MPLVRELSFLCLALKSCKCLRNFRATEKDLKRAAIEIKQIFIDKRAVLDRRQPAQLRSSRTSKQVTNESETDTYVARMQIN